MEAQAVRYYRLGKTNDIKLSTKKTQKTNRVFKKAWGPFLYVIKYLEYVES